MLKFKLIVLALFITNNDLTYCQFKIDDIPGITLINPTSGGHSRMTFNKDGNFEYFQKGFGGYGNILKCRWKIVGQKIHLINSDSNKFIDELVIQKYNPRTFLELDTKAKIGNYIKWDNEDFWSYPSDEDNEYFQEITIENIKIIKSEKIGNDFVIDETVHMRKGPGLIFPKAKFVDRNSSSYSIVSMPNMRGMVPLKNRKPALGIDLYLQTTKKEKINGVEEYWYFVKLYLTDNFGAMIDKIVFDDGSEILVTKYTGLWVFGGVIDDGKFVRDLR